MIVFCPDWLCVPERRDTCGLALHNSKLTVLTHRQSAGTHPSASSTDTCLSLSRSILFPKTKKEKGSMIEFSDNTLNIQTPQPRLDLASCWWPDGQGWRVSRGGQRAHVDTRGVCLSLPSTSLYASSNLRPSTADNTVSITGEILTTTCANVVTNGYYGNVNTNSQMHVFPW